MVITFKPANGSVWPTEQVSYDNQTVVPREGEYVHLHEQGRLALVSQPPVYMATKHGIAGVVIHVLGTDPDAAPMEF